MSYPLRLPPDLDVEAREHCARLGISLNALIAVALDAYLRAGHQRPGVVKRPAAGAARSVKPVRPLTVADQIAALPAADPNGGTLLYHADRRNWRNFHHPDMWPVVDPDWHVPAGLEPEDIEANDAAYWASHEVPVPLVAGADTPVSTTCREAAQ